MQFEWDEKKSRQNLAKHGISFEKATHVFDDPLALTVPDPYEMEERWVTMGLLGGLVVVVVVHTVQEEDYEEIIRIISARKATRHERKTYEESQ